MSGYGQFCPVGKAMELLDERWTMLVIRELLAGSTRFNDLRRGVPHMSPALLSKRLRRLEGEHGTSTATPGGATGTRADGTADDGRHAAPGTTTTAVHPGEQHKGTRDEPPRG